MALTQEQLEYQREYRRNNPERYRKQQKKTIAIRNRKMVEDLDYFVEATYKSLINGAKNRDYPFNISKKQLHTVISNATHCVCSGRKLTRLPGDPNKISIDRIDNRFGYSLKNIQVVAQCVNIHRLDATMEDFILMCRDVVKQDKKNAKRKSR